jgi:hypothetical protein
VVDKSDSLFHGGKDGFENGWIHFFNDFEKRIAWKQKFDKAKMKISTEEKSRNGLVQLG